MVQEISVSLILNGKREVPHLKWAELSSLTPPATEELVSKVTVFWDCLL